MPISIQQVTNGGNVKKSWDDLHTRQKSCLRIVPNTMFYIVETWFLKSFGETGRLAQMLARVIGGEIKQWNRFQGNPAWFEP